MSAPSDPQPSPADDPTATRAPVSTADIGRSAAAAADGDWTDQVTDLIVDSVDKVRTRTTGPILEVAKGAVYAVVALVILVPILVLVTIGVVRGLDLVLPYGVWLVYAILGIIFLIAGVVMWSRRREAA